MVNNVIEVRGLTVVRGPTGAGRARRDDRVRGDRAARAERLRQVDAAARDRRRPAGRGRRRAACSASPPAAHRCAGGSATSPRPPACTTTSRSPRTCASSPACSAARDDEVDRAVDAVDLALARGRASSAGSAAASGRGPASRSRCSAARTCWCSTSRRSASTRCCAATCGTLFHELADGGAAVLVSSHVMDEAERCDQLLLMRDGAILAHDTPAAIKDARRHRRHRGGVPRPRRAGGGMTPRITLAVAGAGAHPAAPRPPHRRDAAGAALPADLAAVVDVRRTRRRPVRPVRAGAARRCSRSS